MADQGIRNKIRIQIVSKIILVVEEDSLQAGGVREVEAFKGSKVMLYVIIVEEQVICRLLVTGGRMICGMEDYSRTLMHHLAGM